MLFHFFQWLIIIIVDKLSNESGKKAFVFFINDSENSIPNYDKQVNYFSEKKKIIFKEYRDILVNYLIVHQIVFCIGVFR